jgi:hypothetical protein
MKKRKFLTVTDMKATGLVRKLSFSPVQSSGGSPCSSAAVVQTSPNARTLPDAEHSQLNSLPEKATRSLSKTTGSVSSRGQAEPIVPYKERKKPVGAKNANEGFVVSCQVLFSFSSFVFWLLF